MKKKLTLMAIFVLMLSLFFNKMAQAQNKDYKVVFDLTSSDTTDYQSLIRWLNGISKGDPNAQLEVVLYGKSLPMVTKGKSTVSADVQSLLENKNVSFNVCEMALKRHQLTKNDLLPGVGTVPDGIFEIIQKQKQGWGYIKAGR